MMMEMIMIGMTIMSAALSVDMSMMNGGKNVKLLQEVIVKEVRRIMLRYPKKKNPIFQKNQRIGYCFFKWVRSAMMTMS